MVFLIVLLLISAAIILGLIYAYKKLSRSKFIGLIALLLVVPFIAFKIYERDFMLSVVPDVLDVNSISYRAEEVWGFGPGGNETGIRIYPLPKPIAKEIEVRGIEFFNSMPPNQNQSSRDWRGRYTDWAETPIKASEHWKPSKESGKLDIDDYLCAYGFCIDIKPEVKAQVNSIINNSGSYYAYGRIGAIIVSPRQKIVLYVYNG
jgi:hypothetical protein